MANFPDSISMSKIHHRLSRRSLMREMAAGTALVAVAVIPEAVAAPPSDPCDLVLLQAHKLAEALNAATGGAWEFNIRYENGFVLISDRGQAEKVAHTVQS